MDPKAGLEEKGKRKFLTLPGHVANSLQCEIHFNTISTFSPNLTENTTCPLRAQIC
jgi:hypothetical protein